MARRGNTRGGVADSQGYVEFCTVREQVRAERCVDMGHKAVRATTDLRSSVYCEAPQSLLVRLLVRQSLSIMVAMMRTKRPGICSLHYAVFMTGISAAGGPAEERDGLGDRMRVNKLYDELM
jgi:transcriptional activator protein UGA3